MNNPTFIRLRFAFKLSFAIVFALFVGFHLNLEPPRWSAMTAAIVAAGTVEPDLQQIAAQMGAPTIAAMLLRRFSHKPGLIGQISGEIMGLSGFDDEDVAEVEAGKL